MTDIGKNTRRETIKKWRDGIQKNTELLLAFPVEQIEDDDIAVFRANCARRIEDLSVFLATGEWSLFLDTPLTFPKARETDDAEPADVVDVADEEQLLLPAPEVEGKSKKTRKKGGKE